MLFIFGILSDIPPTAILVSTENTFFPAGRAVQLQERPATLWHWPSITVPTSPGDPLFSKWGPDGDPNFSEMGTKWGPSPAEWGPKKRMFAKLIETS